MWEDLPLLRHSCIDQMKCTMYQWVKSNQPGLDDLDPAAAFLAREQEQLGELEEEIGSLSGS